MANRASSISALSWICSEGGPLLLLYEGSLDKWGGVIDQIEGPQIEKSYSPSGKRTDYDRACAVSGYLGKIRVGLGEALVLDDMPMQTTWVPRESADGGMLARWMFSESDAEFVHWLRVIPDAIFRTEVQFSVEGSPLVLFDSAFAGRNVRKRPDDYLIIELRPGLYAVKTGVYQPDTRTSIVVHRLEPLL
jgi:Immunity protein 21